nr:CPBP family intramembrane metalloprotease [Candidatus Sigynarchaeota archaeon]
MGEDLFKSEELSQEDKEEGKIRKEVTFDIEVSSEGDKKSAYRLLATMYKKHFLILFASSIVTVVVMFAAFGIYNSVVWATSSFRVMALNLSYLSIPVATLLLMPAVERTVYLKDNWTLERQGWQALGSPVSKKSYFMAIIPAVLLLIPIIMVSLALSDSFTSPFYILFVVGGIPVIIFEELLFRGVYWKYLVMRYGKDKFSMNVVFINAVIFMLIHLPRLFIDYTDGILIAAFGLRAIIISFLLASFFLAGLILGLLRATFKNILAPIAFHISYNSIFIVIKLDVVSIMPLWLLGLVILVVFFLIAQHINLFRIQTEISADSIPAELKKPVLQTKWHDKFRIAFFIANGCIMVYYGSGIAGGDVMSLIIVMIVILGAWAVLGYLYLKKLWIFKQYIE